MSMLGQGREGRRGRREQGPTSYWSQLFLSGITVAIRPSAFSFQRCPKFQDTGFQRIVFGDVLVKVGVANHPTTQARFFQFLPR